MKGDATVQSAGTHRPQLKNATEFHRQVRPQTRTLAPLRRVAQMPLAVLGEVGGAAEPEPAGEALVWPLACVHPQVSLEVSRLPELLPARGALVRLLPRVGPQVVNQVDPLRKRLMADLAHERPLPRVRPLVHGHVVLDLAGVSAEAALVPGGATVCAPCWIGRRERAAVADAPGCPLAQGDVLRCCCETREGD